MVMRARRRSFRCATPARLSPRAKCSSKRTPRILYIEGEPRWEFKFIRRAAEDDRSLQLASMLRTTQNKIYRQGFSDTHELEEGFPAKPEELFAFDGLIVGS